jgi:hypothetical protein
VSGGSLSWDNSKTKLKDWVVVKVYFEVETSQRYFGGRKTKREDDHVQGEHRLNWCNGDLVSGQVRHENLDILLEQTMRRTCEKNYLQTDSRLVEEMMYRSSAHRRDGNHGKNS